MADRCVSKHSNQAVPYDPLFPAMDPWSVEDMQLALEVGDLLATEFGAVAAGAMVGKRGNAAFLVEATPQHEGGAQAAGDVGNPGRGVAQPIEPHRLQARAIGSILGRPLGCQQRPGCFVGQVETSLSHAFHCTTCT